MEMFVDAGVVIGGLQFRTPEGLLRADGNGGGRYAVRVLRTDESGRKWWIFDRSVYIGKMARRFRCRAIYEAWVALKHPVVGS